MKAKNVKGRERCEDHFGSGTVSCNSRVKICHVDGELKFIGDESHLDQVLCKLMAVAI